MPSGGHTRLHKLMVVFADHCHHCRKQVHCYTCHPDKGLSLSATRDHLIPRSVGGRGSRQATTHPNIVLSCWGCNHRKGNLLEVPVTSAQRARGDWERASSVVAPADGPTEGLVDSAGGG